MSVVAATFIRMDDGRALGWVVRSGGWHLLAAVAACFRRAFQWQYLDETIALQRFSK
jgi:hypothetical protein